MSRARTNGTETFRGRPYKRDEPKAFCLVFNDPDEGGTVNIDYEAATPREAAHIVAKIRYIKANLIGN